MAIRNGGQLISTFFYLSLFNGNKIMTHSNELVQHGIIHIEIGLSLK